jgi:hypothetical protein
MGGLATLLLGLATPDTTREWKPIPGVGQPPPTAEDLDLLRRFSTPQEVVDRALIAPRLLPVLEAERVPAVAEMLLLLPATEINATLLRDSLALKVGLQRARVTLTGVGPYGGGWDWPETVRLDPRTHAPFVPHATNTTRVAAAGSRSTSATRCSASRGSLPRGCCRTPTRRARSRATSRTCCSRCTCSPKGSTPPLRGSTHHRPRHEPP